MSKLTDFGAMLPVLVFSSAVVLAQDIDFDDITMTVVGDGMFEARQLPRPSSDAIREFMETNRAALPDLAGPGEEGPGQITPGQEGPGQEGPSQERPGQVRPGQEGPGQERPDTQPVRELIEPDNRKTVSDLRSQRPSPREQRNERPNRPQRPGNRG